MGAGEPGVGNGEGAATLGHMVLTFGSHCIQDSSSSDNGRIGVAMVSLVILVQKAGNLICMIVGNSYVNSLTDCHTYYLP